MGIDSKELSDRQLIVIAILFIMLIGLFIGWHTTQENNAESTIQECPIITVAYPQKFVPQSKMYYYFYINGKKIDDYYRMPFPTMGKFERSSQLMTERFWIKVSCKDYKVNRIYWDAKVPDTLKFVPVGGWDKIPYNLDETK